MAIKLYEVIDYNNLEASMGVRFAIKDKVYEITGMETDSLKPDILVCELGSKKQIVIEHDKFVIIASNCEVVQQEMEKLN